MQACLILQSLNLQVSLGYLPRGSHQALYFLQTVSGVPVQSWNLQENPGTFLRCWAFICNQKPSIPDTYYFSRVFSLSLSFPLNFKNYVIIHILEFQVKGVKRTQISPQGNAASDPKSKTQTQQTAVRVHNADA